MARVRCITEMGMGVDVHGRDATKAAKRAVSDAIRHSSLGFFRMLGKTANDMFVDVMIAVPNPDAVAGPIPVGNKMEDAFEQIALLMNNAFRLSSAPAFPAISFTPIAIYRTSR